MWVFDLDSHEIGVVGCAVGASFAVLVAEEMFASGCELLVSVTSSGQITPQGAPPYFILIDRALRDEGTSYHYIPPSDWSDAPGHLLSRLDGAFKDGPSVMSGATWTTDAPFRETETAISAARARGILAVEMEAAGLYAFATGQPMLLPSSRASSHAFAEPPPCRSGQARSGVRHGIGLRSDCHADWRAQPRPLSRRRASSR
jgi:uridine phosphorylase